ncbi:hypothetical protein [Streptomyces sp. NBC_00690]|uniref:hypothetical protein n=1 Tax=Streptomyces sp. NBC_00690 TaxID=2975808 RepID=UPI002E2AA940|nr:hypothetical protein [Streptomyces sp. NBC_00690]
MIRLSSVDSLRRTRAGGRRPERFRARGAAVALGALETPVAANSSSVAAGSSSAAGGGQRVGRPVLSGSALNLTVGTRGGSPVF